MTSCPGLTTQLDTILTIQVSSTSYGALNRVFNPPPQKTTTKNHTQKPQQQTNNNTDPSLN